MQKNRHKHEILIVDDDPQVHKLISKMLPLETYTVTSAYSATEALTSINTSKPDLVILDIMMPKISGIEVCNKIKGDPVTKDVMVLILSAKDAQADRLDGLAHGADEYIAKPFHMRHLIRKIEHMLSKKFVDEVN